MAYHNAKKVFLLLLLCSAARTPQLTCQSVELTTLIKELNNKFETVINKPPTVVVDFGENSKTIASALVPWSSNENLKRTILLALAVVGVIIIKNGFDNMHDKDKKNTAKWQIGGGSLLTLGGILYMHYMNK